eukprot:CAMPEP_0117588756 /NCGR_PEP_ID=MMETSP0784-20121206/70028_1 /TAXON_ID=39447 /ORGANISM="" /LENGTH=64 /DNA_ID=CAMNT_0005390151 /DNA_START=100 /DNA_END=292 /DNA_ORIENTATION=+
MAETTGVIQPAAAAFNCTVSGVISKQAAVSKRMATVTGTLSLPSFGNHLPDPLRPLGLGVLVEF